MDLFNHLKTIEHSVARWAVEEEFFNHITKNRPLEELSFLEGRYEACEIKNRQRVFRNHPDFPKQVTRLFDTPWSLSFEGALERLSGPFLSVVGSREPSFESSEWMDIHLAEFLRQFPCCVVSGGARGVDQKAHLIALREKRSTLVVLPSGLDQIYPAQLGYEKDKMISKGAIFVSEYGDQQPMRKYLFTHRNRLIAAFSEATLVIQAAEKSGTLMTAHRALELGKPVYVIPGHPLHKNFAGNLELIREGAQVVSNAQDLINFMRVDCQLFEG